MNRTLLILGAALALAGLVLPATAAARGRPPVVMIVFDEFPAESLLGPDGRVDAGRFPNFAKLAGDATWYPNATTVADGTWRSVPAILDGRYPRKGTKSTKRDHKNNLFRLFSRRGYKLRSTEEVTSLCHARGCRRVGNMGFGNLTKTGRFERLGRTIRSIRRGRRPTFTFHHSVLPHQPWVYLPSGRRHQVDWGDFSTGITGQPSFYNPFFTLHSEQRYLLQLGALDRTLGRLVARLRATRQYRRALLVITADHGIAFEVGVDDRRAVTERLADRIANVPLFIKAPGQRRGRVDRAWVRSIDLLPTMAKLLRFRLRWRVDGRPASSRAVRRRRQVKLVLRKFTGTLRMGVDEFQRRRAANTAERLRKFGWGSWQRIYRIGPHTELIGRRVAELPVAGPGDARAELRESERYADVRPRWGFVPASMVGRISGNERSARDVAVAVNGEIEAVGRSARLNGVVGERFAMMVPESSLRRGRNRVEVFEVRGDGGGLSLVRLGRAP